MHAICLALVIDAVRLGVAAQEDCPRVPPPEVPGQSSHGDLGLMMLQVSKEASTVMAKVADRHASAAESHAETSQAAVAGSEKVGDHHTPTSLEQEHQAKKAQEKVQEKTQENSQLQKAVKVDIQALDQEQKVAPITMGSCFSSEYGYIVIFLVALIVCLVAGIVFQYKHNKKLSAKIRGLRARLRADQYLLKADDKKLRAEKELLREEQKRLIEAIHDHGNIFFDPQLRQIVLKRAIPFEPVVRVEGMSMWQSLARYVDTHQALLILSDVAEVCQILPFACFLIEGHTLQSGSLDEIDEFAHEVADARALLVKESLMAFGVPADRLEALGLPGGLGNNRAEVLMKLVN